MSVSSTPGGRWVWVVGPSCYLDEHGEEAPKLRPGTAGLRWACHRDTRPGDLAVLYRSRRAKDLAYLFRATSDPVLEAGAWHCEAAVLSRLPRPVGLAELRADPVTATWPALRASFVRTAFPVPAEVWARVMAMAGSGGSSSPADGEDREPGVVEHGGQRRGAVPVHGHAGGRRADGD